MGLIVNPYRFAAAGGGGSGTPPTFVGSKATFSTASGSASISLTDLLDSTGATATLLQDDFVIIAFENTSTTGSDIDFTPASGWTEEADLFGNDTQKCNLAVWSKFMGASPDTSVTIPTVGSTLPTSVVVHAFRGVSTSTPRDVPNVTATGINSSLPNPGAITPVTGGTVIYVAAGAGDAGFDGHVFTNPGDLSTTTNHFNSDRHGGATTSSVVGAGFVTWSGSGAFDPAQWTGNAVANSAVSSWCALTMALRPADA